MRRIWKHIVTHFITFILINAVFSISQPAQLFRACLDRPTFTLTVTVAPPTDGCGSFSNHRLYGREDGLSPWKLLKEIPTLNITTISTTLPNTKSWELFLSTSFACNGKDTLVSNHVFIDNSAPSQFEPDSVSVDYNTQQLRAGWSKPTEPDIMGFSLFKFSGGGNALLLDTMSFSYLFPLGIFDTKTNNNKFCIAVFDSCLNGGLLSNYHSPIHLMIQMNPEFWCNKKTQITWSKYYGWVTEKYIVWRHNKTQNKWDQLGVVPADLVNDPSTYGFIDATYETNNTYTYYVRAIKQGSSAISSTSNSVTADYVFLGNTSPITLLTGVSVISEDQIQITGEWKKDGTNSFLTLEKKQGLSWVTLKTFSTTGKVTYIDPSTNTNNSEGLYRLIRTNTCGYKDDSCYINNSMLLVENQRVMTWSHYKGWSSPELTTDFNYTLERQSGFTWNPVTTTKSNSYNIPIGVLFGKQRYRVKIYSNDGRLPLAFELYSNEKEVDLGFDSSAFDTMLIPSAFNPSGKNPYFKISNPAIGAGESTMFIYNRWGELLFEGDALLGWNGSDSRGVFVPQGVYVYLVQSNYRNKKTRHSGTIILVQ